jgi:hypothetical protein
LYWTRKRSGLVWCVVFWGGGLGLVCIYVCVYVCVCVCVILRACWIRLIALVCYFAFVSRVLHLGIRSNVLVSEWGGYICLFTPLGGVGKILGR